MILDAALEVFSANGYAGTTMQSVADAAGVTKPVVYDCFANRDELLLALLARNPEVGLAVNPVVGGDTATHWTAADVARRWPEGAW